MKKITNFFIAAALGLSALFALDACEEDNPKLRDDYKIYINGLDRVEGNKAVNQERMTAHEVCLIDTVVLRRWKIDYDGLLLGGADIFSLDKGNLDTVNNRLVMVAGNIDVIEGNVWLDGDFTYYIQNGLYGDTVAYVPTAQRTGVVDELTTLFADGREKNIDKILEIFQTAFVFYPCTGAEFKELEAKGQN